MKTKIYCFFLAILAFSCSEPNIENCAQAPVSTPTHEKKMITIQRHGEQLYVSEDSLKATFKVADKIDSLIIVLGDSITKRGKNFQNIFAAFEKRETEKEIIYFLYPEFLCRYTNHPDQNGTGRTRLTIHHILKDREQRDTLFSTWVSGDERHSRRTPEKRFLKKNNFFCVIESPVGFNNVYHQSHSAKAMVSWIVRVLCTDSPLDQLTGDSEQLYDPETQWNSAMSVWFKGIDAVK